MIARNPRAPVPRFIACWAMATSASSVTTSSTPSISKNLAYCLTREFFGSVSTKTRSSTSRSSTVATTGSRPMNSGMRP